MNHPLSFFSRASQLPCAVTIPKKAHHGLLPYQKQFIVVPKTPREIKIQKAPWDIKIPENTVRYYNTKKKDITIQITRWNITRGADKSLARSGRKQATATKLGIY